MKATTVKKKPTVTAPMVDTKSRRLTTATSTSTWSPSTGTDAVGITCNGSGSMRRTGKPCTTQATNSRTIFPARRPTAHPSLKTSTRPLTSATGPSTICARVRAKTSRSSLSSPFPIPTIPSIRRGSTGTCIPPMTSRSLCPSKRTAIRPRPCSSSTKTGRTRASR